GIRALSRYHLEHPFVFNHAGQEYRVGYLPADSDSGMFGGNSNWRGPVWMPANLLLIEALQRFHDYYGDDFRIEYPTGSGRKLSFLEIGVELSKRLSRLFLRDEKGRRAIFGDNDKMQRDPHFKDYILFYEYFDGENGRGLGASHQTGWTGLVTILLLLGRRKTTS
ncbi:MAG TPA: glucosidase, partial [Puia sp.]|nr:glucosidase [Puia sp.]